MKLGIGERLALQNILPPEGDIITIKIVRDLRSALGFSEDEIKQHNIRPGEGNRIEWDREIEKEVEIGPKATAIIVSTLEELNKEKKLTEAYISAYEKFIPGG